MRLLILAICLTAALADHHHHRSGPGYLPDRLYHYKYLTTLYTGYSGLKPQYEGTSLRVDVLLQRQADYYVIRLERPELALAQKIHNIDEHDYHYVENPEFAEVISKPFRAVYKDGQLYRYDVSREEPEYSVNIKRAILHLLNLNFEQTDAVRYHRGDHLHRPDPEASYYTVLEDGRGGKCETTYVIHSEPYYRTPYYNNVLNVTKTRNYHNCLGEPYHEYNAVHGEKCEECEVEETDPLHKNSRYHYNIRGDRHSYIIERVFSEGELVYAPYTTEGQTAFIYENRTLELVGEDESNEKIHVPTDVVSYYSLDFTFGERHRFDDAVDLKEAHYYYDIYKVKIAVETVGKILDRIVSSYQKVDTTTRLEETLPLDYLELVRRIATLDYDEIDRVYRSYVEGKSEEYKQLFYDALSTVGTNPAFLYGVNLIKNEHVSTEVAKYFVQTVVYHLKEPSEVLLDEFYRLCDHSYVRGRYDLHSACYLAFSGLVYQTCVAGHHEEEEQHEHRRDEHECTPERATKYLHYFVSQYHHKDNDYYETAYLKVIGNSGLLEGIRYLRPYVLGEEHHALYHRVTAVWALRRIVDSHPEEVLELLFPVYANISEDYELRIAAFSLIVSAHPTEYKLEAIAHSLYDEPSDQVASYVYSTFYYLANSTHPCHRRISRISKYILEVLDDYEPVHPDFDHAFNYHNSGYEKKYDYGGFTHVAYVPSNSSYIPRKLYVSFNDYIGGRSHDALAVGFHSYGLDRYFDRIFGPKGLFKESSLFEFFGRRSRRDVSPVEKEVRDVDEKLHLVHRDYEPVYGNIFLKVYDTEIDFFHFNESLFDHIIKEGHYLDFLKHEDHRPFLYRRFLLGTDKTYVFASESGLPLIYEVKQPIYVHYHNNEFKADLTPEPPKEGFYIPKQVKLHLDGHLVYDRVIEVALETALPFTKAYLGTGAVGRSALNVPLKFDLTADLENHKIVYKHVPLIPHEVYQSYFQPFTYFIPLKDIESENFDVLHQIHYLYDEDLEEEEEDYFQDYLGLGYRVSTRHRSLWNDRGSWNDFLHSHELRDLLYYYFLQPHFHPYVFNLTLIGADQDATTELESTYNYNYYGLGARDNRPYKSKHFEEDLEDYGSDKKWYTHVLTADEYARGSKERHARIEFTYSYSYDYLYHKYNLYYDRTPFHHSETDNFKICSAGYIKYPHHDLKKFFELQTQELEQRVDAKVNVYFGKDCKSDKKITVTGHFDKTEEQIKHEARREEPVTYERYNEYAYYYQKCLEERQHGRYYNSYCRYYLHLATELRKYEFDIKYENLPESFRNFTYHLGNHFRHHYYTHVEYDPYATNPDGHVRVEANQSLHDPVADVRVYKPHETTYYTHIHVPHFHPLSTHPSPEYSNVQEYFGYYHYPYCFVQKDEVQTFDNVTYTLPPIDCYKVIAKDCSPKEEFLVLGKRVSGQQYEKAVLVYFGKYKVEVVPEGSQVVVRVNDKQVTVNEAETYYQYINEDGHQITVFFISYNGHHYTFHSHPYSLTVDYDGKVIYVEVSPYHRGKLCGLCGDYNGDRYEEFRGPEGHVYHDTTAYGYSYAVPDDHCKVPEFERPRYHERVEGCTVHRNRHIYYGSRSRQSCFTTRPLPRCAEGCVPTRYIKRTVPFHCLPVKESYTRHLLDESEHRELDELRRKHEDHYAEVEYPESCHLPEH